MKTTFVTICGGDKLCLVKNQYYKISPLTLSLFSTNYYTKIQEVVDKVVLQVSFFIFMPYIIFWGYKLWKRIGGYAIYQISLLLLLLNNIQLDDWGPRNQKNCNIFPIESHNHHSRYFNVISMVLKTGPEREPKKGVVPVLVVRPGSDRWSNRWRHK